MTQPLDILHVVHSLEAGGMENGIVNIARTLDPERFRTFVCCLERGGAFARRLPHPERVFVLDKPPPVSPATAFKLARLIRTVRPRLVHTHNLGPLIYGTAATLGGRWVPLLHGEHRQLMPEEQTPAKLRLRRWLYRACRRVHTVSKELRRHLLDLGLGDEKMISIPNGVDTALFAPIEAAQARAALGLPTEGPVFGIVGRLRPEKRHYLLLNAFYLLRAELPRAYLLVVGDGPEADVLHRLAGSLTLGERVRFVGHQDQLQRWYPTLDLMVIPSAAEGLSNAALEAMACGVPVLASHACGMEDLIHHGETGFLAPAMTAEALADAMRNAWRYGKRLTAVGREARRAVEERYSLKPMVQRYERLYLELASNSRR